MKRLLSVILCLCLLLSSAVSLASGMSCSADRYNVSDNTGPSVIKYVFGENGKTLAPGNKLHVKVKLDDQSDITGCDVFFQGKNNQDAAIGVILEYDAASDMFKGEYELTEFDVDDTYTLDAISAQDKYGNFTQVWNEKAGLGSFTLQGGIVTLKVRGTAKITENRKTLKPEEKGHITLKVEKVVSKADYIEANFQRANDTKSRLAFSLDKVSSWAYEGTFYFIETDKNGKYSLVNITFYDEFFNVVGVMNVTGQYVMLRGASDDVYPPTVSAVKLQEKGKALKAGNTIHLSAKVKDDADDLMVYGLVAPKESISYVDENNLSTSKTGSMHIVDMAYNKSTGRYEGTWKLPKDLPDGEYTVGISASDSANNGGSKFYENLSFTYSSPDFADKGIKSFITVCWKAFFGKKPTKAEIKEYGTPLASGKKKAVNVINTLLKKSKLSGNAAAEALWQIMQGKNPSAEEKAKTVAALKEGKDIAIDSLNNSAFRKRCNEWGINPGTLDTGKSSTKVASVDVDGGHYTLNGSKATFTGATQKDVKSLVIPDTVKANGKTYKVTKIEGAACKGLKKLSSVTIGKNVTAIGQDAFKDCKALKTVTINAAKLKTVGKDSFSGISKKAVFKLPKKQLSAYKKLIKKNGGAPGTAKYQEK